MSATSTTRRSTPPSGSAGWRWRLAQKLEARWWQRYLKGKDPQAYRAWKANYWRELLAPFAPALHLDEPQTLLDAGCGPAGINLVLPEAGTASDPAARSSGASRHHAVTALDPLLDRYRALPAWPVLRREGVTYQTGTLEEAPALLGEHRFDGIACLNAINHVNDLGLALEALGRLGKPGAWLLLGVDVHTASWRKQLFRAIPGDALHPHQHDTAEYRRLLQDRGWTLLDERTHKPGRIFDYVLLLARFEGV